MIEETARCPDEGSAMILPTAAEAAVELVSIGKSFGSTRVLHDVSFQVGRGEFVTLLGPSGCGKTTSLRIIAGFEAPSTGDVRFGADSVVNLPPWRRDIGIVFQSYALFPYLTAFDNIAFGLKMRRRPKAEIRTRVEAALQLVGLAGFGARHPRHLSGGQRQRVALARALVIEPRLLLLDEPLSNLDAKLRGEMRMELKRIQRESGVTTVFVTHDQEEAFSLSDRIILMSDGTIRQNARPRDLWERPASGFVADFIGVENLLPARLKSGEGGCRAVLSETVSLPVTPPKENPARPLVALRAADLHIAEGQVPGVGGLSARVLDVDYRGESCAYRLAVAGLAQPLVAVAPSHLRLSGDSVTVTPDPGKIMVLNDDR